MREVIVRVVEAGGNQHALKGMWVQPLHPEVVFMPGKLPNREGVCERRRVETFAVE